MSCGTWPADSLASIRGARDAARDKVAGGINTAVQKKITRHEMQEEAAQKPAAIEAARVTNLKIQDMFDAWTTDGVRRKDGNAMLLRMFNADVLPPLGAIAVMDTTEHHLHAVLRAMVDRGVNRSAVMMHANLVQMFAWARKRQPWRKLMVEGDPMDLIEIDRIVSPEYDIDNQPDRMLSPAAIVDLRDNLARQQAEYDAAPNERIVPQPVERHTQLGIWIMLPTMCRVGEMSMARWEHIDLAAGEWFIPKANDKDNLADLTVYLSDHGNGLLSQWRGYGGDGGYAIVFDTGRLKEALCTENIVHAYATFCVLPVEYFPPDGGADRLFQFEESRETEEFLRSDFMNRLKVQASTLDSPQFAALNILSALYKSQGFEEEQEIRVMVMPASDQTKLDNAGILQKAAAPQFRPRNGTLVPYLDLNLLDGSNRLPVTRIIVGPHPNAEKRASSLRMLVRQIGLDADVIVSETPYIGG
jgi:integrase